MERVLALDLGLTFGFADGTMSGAMRVNDDNRMLSFYNTLLDLLLEKRKGPLYTAIVYEDAKFQMGNAIYNFNAQKGILQLLAESLHIDFIGISPMTVKKIFCGDGKASKEDMLKKASEVSGKEIKNHNEADAIGLYFTYINSKKQ